MRTVTDASVTRHGDFVIYSVTGNGFLYNMVRIMVGTLLEAARGVYTPADVLHMLEGRDRSAAGPTAPPHGLYLDTVFYDD